MRTRGEINNLKNSGERSVEALSLEVLLDIRDRLAEPIEDKCNHSYGLCARRMDKKNCCIRCGVLEDEFSPKELPTVERLQIRQISYPGAPIGTSHASMWEIHEKINELIDLAKHHNLIK